MRSKEKDFALLIISGIVCTILILGYIVYFSEKYPAHENWMRFWFMCVAFMVSASYLCVKDIDFKGEKKKYYKVLAQSIALSGSIVIIGYLIYSNEIITLPDKSGTYIPIVSILAFSVFVIVDHINKT